MEKDPRINQTEDQPERDTQRKRHGNVGFAVISVALLLVIVGLAIYVGVKSKELKDAGESSTPIIDTSLAASEDTPKSVAEEIAKQSEEAPLGQNSEFFIIDFISGEPEDQLVDDPGYDGASMEAEFGTSQISETEESVESTEETESSSASESSEVVESSQATESSQPAETKQQVKEQKPKITTDPMSRVIDFATLQTTKNADIYAWIAVPGTNIDYPVLRHPTDDGYYLYHNLNGSQGYPGCIYTENWNTKDWTDPVTVLYGHDMRSTGTMFHQLHKFETQSFFDKNEYFYIYTPDKTLQYRIFSAYVHTNEHLLANHSFSVKEQFDSFFGMVLATNSGKSHVRDGVEISSESKIVALSTCIKNQPTQRYIIFGVLIN